MERNTSAASDGIQWVRYSGLAWEASVIRPIKGAIACVQKLEERITKKILKKRNVIGFVALLTTAIPVWADSTSPTSDEAVLVSAAEHGKNEEIRKLLMQGVDVNGKYYDSTALTEAIVKKHIATVKLLLEAGANPNLPNVSESPLSLAAVFGVPEIAALLLQHGADPNFVFKDDDPLCALTWLARYSEFMQVEIAHLLIQAGASASVNRPCQRLAGNTPLRAAIARNKVAVAKVLLLGGANPNETVDRKSAVHDEGEVPLQAAVFWGTHFKDTSMAELLLDFGADPNYQNNRIFDEFNRNNSEDSWNGTSSLDAAAGSGSLPMVRLLLDRRADPCLIRTDGVSPYQIARQSGHKKVATLISEYSKKRSCTEFSSTQ